jgi:hypothetical protein
MLKIAVPVDEGLFNEANERARTMSGSNGEGSPISKKNGGDADDFQFHRQYSHQIGHENLVSPIQQTSTSTQHKYPPGPPGIWSKPGTGNPLAYLIRSNGSPSPNGKASSIAKGDLHSPSGSSRSNSSLSPKLQQPQDQIIHNVLCTECCRLIVGTRWLCSNCPTVPAYNLCSDCEKSASIFHDPFHAFLRLTRNVEKKLPDVEHLLPRLYLSPSANENMNGERDGVGEEIQLRNLSLLDDENVEHKDVIW